MKILSLFSGCGGLDLGFEGGFNVLRRSINEKINPNWIEDEIDENYVKLIRTDFETVRECARIQSFPDDYNFIIPKSVSTSNAYKLIGNAVSPLLGFNIAMRLKENWSKYFNK